VKPGARIKDLPWKPSGLVLDPFAGKRQWWKGVDTKVVFVDRWYHEPGTICASVSNLPFADATFDQAWADPPHFIRKSPLKNSRFGAENRHYQSRGQSGDGRCYFGAYPTRDEARLEWLTAAMELHRVIKPNGTLVWKSITGAKTVSQCVNDDDLMFCLTPWWDIAGYVTTKSRVTWSSASTVHTLWKRRNLQATQLAA
jgi:hypothetical protein